MDNRELCVGRAASASTNAALQEVMRKGFIRLMTVKESDGLVWLGSQSDLVELCHAMWMEGYAVGCDGTAFSFCDLVRRLCCTLHVSSPKNPTAVVNNIRRRKKPGQSLVERCRMMMVHYGNEDPLASLTGHV